MYGQRRRDESRSVPAGLDVALSYEAMKYEAQIGPRVASRTSRQVLHFQIVRLGWLGLVAAGQRL